MPDNFGERLRTFRKKAGLTQEELADMLGLSYMTVRRWEAGKVTPRIDEIKALATHCSLLHQRQSQKG